VLSYWSQYWSISIMCWRFIWKRY